MEKIQGVKNFGNDGEGRFREILSCPPPKCVLPLKCPPPPQIPRPGAATVSTIFSNAAIHMFDVSLDCLDCVNEPDQQAKKSTTKGCDVLTFLI